MELSRQRSRVRPRSGSRSYVQYIYLLEAICPTKAIPPKNGRKLPPEVLPELLAKRKTQSLRNLAREYGVSHEAIRGTLKAAKST